MAAPPPAALPPETPLPEAPSFRPTAAQWADPAAYLGSIRPLFEHAGIAVIVPPLAPLQPAGVVLRDWRFTTRLQRCVAPSPDGASPAVQPSGRMTYSLPAFERAANDFAARRLGAAAAPPPAVIERLFWAQMQRQDGPVVDVEYGSELEGTAFSTDAADALARSGWNLGVLSRGGGGSGAPLPLAALRTEVPGVTSPFLSVGMLFAHDAWRVEEHWLYSASYLHLGAPKTHYAVPPADVDAFEAAFAATPAGAAATRAAGGDAAAALARAAHVLPPPAALPAARVRCVRALQRPGDFVVTLPRAYHASLCHGFSVAESVAFALPDWLPVGCEARQWYRARRVPQVLPLEELLCRAALPAALAAARAPPGAPAPGGADAASTAALQAAMRASRCARRAVGAAGARLALAPATLVESVPCGACGDGCFLAVVLCACAPAPVCAACAASETSTCACGAGRTVFLRPGLPSLERALGIATSAEVAADEAAIDESHNLMAAAAAASAAAAAAASANTFAAMPSPTVPFSPTPLSAMTCLPTPGPLASPSAQSAAEAAARALAMSLLSVDALSAVEACTPRRNAADVAPAMTTPAPAQKREREEAEEQRSPPDDAAADADGHGAKPRCVRPLLSSIFAVRAAQEGPPVVQQQQHTTAEEMLQAVQQQHCGAAADLASPGDSAPASHADAPDALAPQQQQQQQQQRCAMGGFGSPVAVWCGSSEEGSEGGGAARSADTP